VTEAIGLREQRGDGQDQKEAERNNGEKFGEKKKKITGEAT